jgi:hypothetical protein
MGFREKPHSLRCETASENYAAAESVSHSRHQRLQRIAASVALPSLEALWQNTSFVQWVSWKLPRGPLCGTGGRWLDSLVHSKNDE